MKRVLLPAALLCRSVATARAEQVGHFRDDWTGNGMVVEALGDRQVASVTRTLIYVGCSRQIKDASAKMGCSTVSLYNAHASSAGAKP